MYAKYIVCLIVSVVNKINVKLMMSYPLLNNLT